MNLPQICKICTYFKQHYRVFERRLAQFSVAIAVQKSAKFVDPPKISCNMSMHLQESSSIQPRSSLADPLKITEPEVPKWHIQRALPFSDRQFYALQNRTSVITPCSADISIAD